MSKPVHDFAIHAVLDLSGDIESNIAELRVTVVQHVLESEDEFHVLVWVVTDSGVEAGDAGEIEIDVIAAAVSHVDPIVVLYLETHDDFQQHYSSDPVPIFRALLQFFSDCLDRVNSSDVR